jgi:D-alanyl-lipoteichoic acid acyltransferase DltB (MBOAT superfamily)
MILTVCCLISFGVLGVFKYYDFFVTSFVDAFAAAGIHLQAKTLHLILPVGISFYTFHTLSYTIDLYRRKFEPTKDIGAFFLFVSIFPLAMAGPIERATNLLPQIYKRRSFDYGLAVDGLRQILWGLFKKVAIADVCAVQVNQIFDSYQTSSGSVLLVGAILFAFQIYADFSGYSDMALGVGKLLGFKFLRNFNYPYFSRDIAEFWRRWHISLNTWFRDYLYVPLGGSRGSKAQIIRNTFVIFLVSGFWHGANWTFIAWGAFHAVLFLPLILLGKNRKHLNPVAEGKIFPNIKEIAQIGFTFLLVVVGWIFFRAETIGDAIAYISGIFSPSLFTIPAVLGLRDAAITFSVLLIIEWLGRNDQHPLERLGLSWKRPFRWALYCAIIAMMLWFSVAEQQDFIYFQF